MNTTLEFSPQAPTKPILPLRYPQREGEGFQAYLIRLCEKNRIANPVNFARRIGLGYADLAVMGNELLQKMLHGLVVPSSLKGIHQRHIENSKSIYSGVFKNTRVCTQCLREDNPIPAFWDLPLTISCREHHILLLDTCPACKSKLSHLRSRVYFCDCGADLRTYTTEPEPTWVDLFHRLFRPWSEAGNSQGNDLIDKEHYAFNLLRAFLPPIDLRTRFRGGIFNGKIEQRIEAEMIGEVGALLENWPTAFQERVKERDRLAHKNLLMFLKKYDRLGLDEISAAARAVALDQRKVNPAITTNEDRPITSIGQLSNLLGLRFQTIKKLIKKGEIKAKLSESDTGRFLLEVGQEETQLIYKLHRTTIRLKEAADRIGCTPILLNMFSRAGFVQFVRFTNESTSWRFRPEDLDAAVQRLLKLSIDSSESKDQLIRLVELMPANNRGRPDDSWIRLAKRFFSKSVALYQISDGPPGFASLAIRRADLPIKEARPV